MGAVRCLARLAVGAVCPKITSVKQLAKSKLSQRAALNGVAMAAGASGAAKFKVLFCGVEFRDGYKLTKAALQNDPDVEVVKCDREMCRKEIRDAVVAVPLTTKLTQPILEGAKELKLIIQYGVGLEGVDIATVHPFCPPPLLMALLAVSWETPNALSCAEHAIYLMMALLRQQKQMEESIQRGWVGVPTGDTLVGKRVLIIGFGGIAQELIPRLKPFQVHLIGARKQPWSSLSSKEEGIAGLLDERYSIKDVAGVLPTADFVVLACLQNEETKGMVDHEFFSHCKDGVRIVNVCRGGLLNKEATLKHLRDGKIGGLGLDVQWVEPFDPEDEIAKHPKVILTPHVAGVTEPSYRAMAHIVAREVQRIKNGQRPSACENAHLLESTLAAERA